MTSLNLVVDALEPVDLSGIVSAVNKSHTPGERPPPIVPLSLTDVQ